MKITEQQIRFYNAIIQLELAGAWYLASILRKQLLSTLERCQKNEQI